MFSFELVFCLPVLHALVVLVEIFADVGGFSDNRFGDMEIALAVVGGHALVFDVSLNHGLLVVDDGGIIDQALHRGRFLLEIVPFVDVLDDALVFVLDVLDFFL